MRCSSRQIAIVVIAAIAAAGCVHQIEVIKLYEDPARTEKTYRRLLVIDISKDSIQQRQFENKIVNSLDAQRVSGIASHTRITSKNGVLQKEIDRLSDEIGADGILITHIANVDTDVDFEEGRSEVKSECRGGDLIDYFLYDHEVLKEPDSVKIAHTVVVVSNLYDASSHKRVWTIQSTCFDKSSMSEVLLDEANAIVNQLRIDKLI